jgi:hypothetical protein
MDKSAETDGADFEPDAEILDPVGESDDFVVQISNEAHLT